MEEEQQGCLPWIIIIGFICFMIFSYWPTSTIKAELESEFPLQRVGTKRWVYETPQSSSELIDEITSIEDPYQQTIDPAEKSILLYPDYAVAVIAGEEETELEVLSHRRAHRRHTTIISTHWGGLRNGSIGNPPRRGGGFGGFGK